MNARSVFSKAAAVDDALTFCRLALTALDLDKPGRVRRHPLGVDWSPHRCGGQRLHGGGRVSFSVASSIEHVCEVAGGFPPDDTRDPYFEERDEDELPDDDEGYPMSMWDPVYGWIDA